ncbi:MAG: MFS transporter, partial [Dehalococcoidales bacterium]
GSRGIPAGTAASVFSFMAPAQIAGTFLAGFMADKYPNRYLMAAGQVVLILAMLLTFIISAPWHAFLYGAISGFGAGFVMTVGSVIWPNYFGRMHLGSIRGVATAGMVIFSALGPLPFGLIFDQTESYSLAILIFLALPLACAVAALLARPPHSPEME